MKLQGLEDEFIFDEISSTSCKVKIIFLTTLVNIETFELPECLPIIYTSEILKEQFLLYFQNQGKELDPEKIHVLKPFEEEILGLFNGVVLEVLPCLPQDASTGFMLAFRKGLRITHFYAGIASDISSTLVNTAFAKWLRASGGSIDNLYIMNHASTERCSSCESESAFENVQKQINDENVAKVLIRVPLFGCEVFLDHLATEYPGNVALDGLLYELFGKTLKAEMKNFTQDFEMATIVVSYTELPLEPDCSIETTVETYDLKWSPLPELFELNLLTRLLRPKNISYISDINSYKIMQTPVVQITKYLLKNTTSTVTKSNEISSRNCCCSTTSTLHTNYMDCMKDFVFKTTNEFYNADILESSSHSYSERPATNRTPMTVQSQNQRVRPLQRRSHQKTSQRSSLKISQPTMEQPTTSKATTSISARLLQKVSNSKDSNPKTISPDSPSDNVRKILNSSGMNNLVYRRGKRGLCFEDDSSSSD